MAPRNVEDFSTPLRPGTYTRAGSGPYQGDARGSHVVLAQTRPAEVLVFPNNSSSGPYRGDAPSSDQPIPIPTTTAPLPRNPDAPWWLLLVLGLGLYYLNEY